MAATVKRKQGQAVEAELLREEMKTELYGLIPPAIVFSVNAFFSQRPYALTCGLGTVGFIMVSQCFTIWVMKTSIGSDIREKAIWNDAFHHMARTLAHILWIVKDNDDMIGRLIMLFIAPADAARMSRHRTFTMYMGVHVLLTVFRFWNDLSIDFPYVVAVLASTQILYEISLMKMRSEESAMQKSQQLSRLAESVVTSTLACFCDATARLSSDLKFLEASTTLSTLLTRRVNQGGEFTDMIHMGDRDHYREFIKALQESSSQSEGEGKCESDIINPMKLQSTKLNLVDSMSIPVEVHLFHAYFEDLNDQPVYLIGVHESWKPKAERARSQSRGRSRQSQVTSSRINFETGRLEPSSSLYSPGDETRLRKSSDPDAAVVRRRRSDSPIPGSARGSMQRSVSPKSPSGFSLQT